MDKQSVVQPYNGLLFGNQMNELLIWAALSVNFKTLCFVKEVRNKKDYAIFIHFKGDFETYSASIVTEMGSYLGLQMFIKKSLG